MTASPLQFARAFAALKSALATQPVGDRRLLTLAEFWPNLADHRGNASYQSYVDEFAALFADSLSADGIADCSPEELVKIRCVARDVAAPGQWEAIDHALARAWAYAGEIERAVRECAEATGEVEALSGLAEEGGAGETPLSERERLIETATRLREKAPLTAARLEQIAAEWEDELGHLWFDRVRCLLVETNGDETARGRMRTLVGAVEPIGRRLHRPSGAESDEVTFEGQLRTADDPFIGVVYDSLKSVRPLLRRPGMLPKTARRKDGEESFHAHYRLEGNSGAVTGNSIGLAAALIAYTQLLRPEIQRHERFVSSEVAFTGSIDEEGRLLPVNAVTLPAKLERAFFSPVRYVVVPNANEAEAHAALAKLSRRYPHRKLRLIAAERLADVVENRNIVRSERVCMGEFVARKAVRWGRGMPLQAGMLAVLVYVLLAITWTKTFAPWWFDWNVASIEIEGDHFWAVNEDGERLWRSEGFGNILDEHTYTGHDAHPNYLIEDLDGDGRTELIFTPAFSYRESNESQHIYAFEDNGRLLWSQRTTQPTTYPGDTSLFGIERRVTYSSAVITAIVGSGGWLVVTRALSSLPVRLQVMAFGIRGNCISGPYVHTGAEPGAITSVSPLTADVNGDGTPEFFMATTNNRYERAGLAILDPLNLYGVSPPFDEPLYRASGMPPGSHLYYVAFAKTALSQPPGSRAWAISVSEKPGSAGYDVRVVEGYTTASATNLADSRWGIDLRYSLDTLFQPTSVFVADHYISQVLQMERAARGDSTLTIDEIYLEWIHDVIVYHGDSIVYHPAGGIDPNN